MTNKTYERAFNIAIKYGFCSDCVQDLDKGHCHECDCYQNAVKVIRDALEKLDAIEESKATVWHDAQNDPPKKKRRIPVFLRILPLWQLQPHVPHNGSWTIFQWSMGW